MAEVTWNLAGLRPEVQETAREAARRSGLSVAEWLQAVILESAASRGVAPQVSRLDEPSDAGADLESLQARLGQLSAQLARLTRDEDASGVASGDPHHEDQSEFITALRTLESRLHVITQETIAQGGASAHELGEALERINERLDFLASEGRATSSELEQRIAAVDRVLSTMKDEEAESSSVPSISDPAPAARPVAAEQARREPPRGKTSLASAIAQIEARQRELDTSFGARDTLDPAQQAAPSAPPSPVAERPSHVPPTLIVADERLSGMEQRLAQLSQQLESLQRPSGFEEAISSLREELADIHRKVTDAAPQRALEAIEAEVRALGRRIDVGRDYGADQAVLANIESGLEQVRDVLQTLAPAESLVNVREEIRALHARIESIANSGSDAATLRQVQTSIADLRAVAARAASGEALIVLAEEVQILGDKIDRYVAPSVASKDTLSNLDYRFNELADVIRTQQETTPAILTENVTSLVESLGRKLDQTAASREQAVGLEQIARRLDQLNDKLQSADTRLENLGAIENNLSELYQQFETFRETALAAARAAHEIASTRGQSREGDVESLKQDIDSLRETQLTTERKTQDRLEAVHDTLERMVERLASVEKSEPVAPTPRPAAEATDPHEDLTRSALSALRAPQTAPRDTPGPDEVPLGKVSSGVVTMPTMANPVERRPIDPSLPADTPLEPGVGASRGRQPVTAAERIAASEAVLSESGQNPEPDAKANFIAAARRAAQAAANISTPTADSPPAAKQGGSRFGLIAQKITGRRLVVVVLSSVIAGGTTHILTNVHSPKELWQLASTQVTGLQQSLLQTETTTKLAAAAKKTAKPLETAAVPKAAGQPPISVPTTSQMAAEQTASITPAAPPAAPESSGASESTTTATVSPLTIASIKLPTDVTGAISKQTKFNQLPAQLPPADAATLGQALPAAFGAALKAAALADDPAAEYEIGMRYAEGRGVPVNLEEAAHWLERAAARDLVPAQYRLGSLYEKGQGVKKDLEKARQLYRLAADRGNAKAMHNLAVLHAEGVEGKPDFKSAAHWFRRAADAGIADSQYNLGIMLARGLGIEQNLSESYKWFALAAQRGDADAAKKRDDVAARLDQQALGIAKLAVQAFSPEAQPDEAVNVKAPAEGWDKANAAAVKGRGKPAPVRRTGA